MDGGFGVEPLQVILDPLFEGLFGIDADSPQQSPGQLAEEGLDELSRLDAEYLQAP